MQVVIEGQRLTIKRETTDKRVKTESELWYRLRNWFKAKESGAWVKIRDPGALTAMPYALREGPHRKVNRMVIDPYYQIRCPAISFNTEGEAVLQICKVDSF